MSIGYLKIKNLFTIYIHIRKIFLTAAQKRVLFPYFKYGGERGRGFDPARHRLRSGGRRSPQLNSRAGLSYHINYKSAQKRE